MHSRQEWYISEFSARRGSLCRAGGHTVVRMVYTLRSPERRLHGKQKRKGHIVMQALRLFAYSVASSSALQLE